VRGLGLKSQKEWRDYYKSGKKLADIPNVPHRGVYAEDGWAGMGDWLGTGRRRGGWQSFKKARAFVRSLGLKSVAEWHAYCKSGKKPDDIPVAPRLTYLNEGWADWGDWLGTGRLATHLRQYRSFDDARTFVRGLSLKSQAEWTSYNRSGKKPDDIPANPNQVYAKDGWAGMGDWLGTGTVAAPRRELEARTVV
jgi:hypothetical protein